MTTSEMPFTEQDISTWTHKRVKLHIQSSKNKLKSFYLNFFGWSGDEYKEAKDHTVAQLREHFDLTKKFPTTGPQAKLRYTIQTNLVRDWPELFVDRHGPDPPAWFDVDLISRPPSDGDPFNMKNVVQQFISHTRNFSRHHFANLKRKHHAEYDDDDEENRSDVVLNKQPRTTQPDRPTPLSIATSTSVPLGLPVGASRFRASGQGKPPGRSLDPREEDSLSDGATYHPATTTRRYSSLSLVLYIIRVTIVDQTLVLERDRFGIVDNLFERGRLVESYIHELVFGNTLNDKPTFLWYFDDTSDDKPRCIRNRPSAEAAIIMLREQADRAGATGIQLFDAPDCDTAALVPVHEVTRKNDFVQRASFELEIDNEENDDDNDDDREEAEKASKVDSAYESRDGELEMDDITVKEETESGPEITWAGQQQQSEKKVESKSESDEDEDIGGFYR
jgi:hypothetical protein